MRRIKSSGPRPPLHWLATLALAAAACGGDGDSGDAGPADSGAVDTGPSAGDLDNDGWPNEADNCPEVFNLEQRDRDQDGVGDSCDSCPATPNAGEGDEPGQDACNLADEAEPNDDSGSAQVVGLMPAGTYSGVRGTIERPVEGRQAVDRYQIMVPGQSLIAVRVARAHSDSLLQPVLRVTGGRFGTPRTADGRFVAERQVYFTEAGTYEILVSDRRGVDGDEAKGGEYDYELSLLALDYSAERVTLPFEGRTALLSPPGKVGIFEADLAISGRTRIEVATTLTETREGSEGIDPIVVLEAPDGTFVDENDNFAPLSYDSRLLAAIDSAGRYRVILDHARIVGDQTELTWTLDQPPDDQELEPNDSPEFASPLLPFPDVTRGTIAQPKDGQYDTDWFSFDANAGTVLSFNGNATPGSALDPIMAIGTLDADGNFTRMYQNAMLSADSTRIDAILPETRTYHLAITDERNLSGDLRGGPLFQYAVFWEPGSIAPSQILTGTGTISGTINPSGQLGLHVATTTVPTFLDLMTTRTGDPDMVPHARIYDAGLTAVLGDGVGDALAVAPTPSDYVVAVHNENDMLGGAAFSYQMRARYVPYNERFESEPNDDIGQENGISPIAALITGELALGTDVDRFRFTARAGQELHVVFVAGEATKNLRLLEDGTATVLIAAAGSIRGFVIPADDDYDLEVSGTEAGSYAIAIFTR